MKILDILSLLFAFIAFLSLACGPDKEPFSSILPPKTIGLVIQKSGDLPALEVAVRASTSVDEQLLVNHFATLISNVRKKCGPVFSQTREDWAFAAELFLEDGIIQTVETNGSNAEMSNCFVSGLWKAHVPLQDENLHKVELQIRLLHAESAK